MPDQIKRAVIRKLTPRINKISGRRRQFMIAIIATLMVTLLAGTEFVMSKYLSQATDNPLNSQLGTDENPDQAGVKYFDKSDSGLWVDSKINSTANGIDPHADVSVGGKDFNVPVNGTQHHEIINGNGRTSLTISSNTVSSGHNNSNTTTNLDISSNTHSNNGRLDDFSP